MSKLQTTLFDDQRLTLSAALDLTAQSLIEYGQHYRHWAIAYSGGKDSTATVAAVCYLLATGRVPAPESLTILYADTRQELPPLHIAAMRMLDVLRQRGHRVIQVLPKLDDRYFVYILGRGVPPPNKKPASMPPNGAMKKTGKLFANPTRPRRKGESVRR